MFSHNIKSGILLIVASICILFSPEREVEFTYTGLIVRPLKLLDAFVVLNVFFYEVSKKISLMD